MVRPRSYPPKRSKVWVVRSWPPMCGPRHRIDVNRGGGGIPVTMASSVLLSKDQEEESEEWSAGEGLEEED
ncbi:unnamed protein product [Linum trigynum]|uniref:Uncharacterized protein n=1 Tax=Linum trigynum TaxID=586398 RepID=A0AAV2DDU0_9ROSI